VLSIHRCCAAPSAVPGASTTWFAGVPDDRTVLARVQAIAAAAIVRAIPGIFTSPRVTAPSL
jgi:hypothetical protein